MTDAAPARPEIRTEATRARVEAYRAENQPQGDLGNGFFRNPVISGGYGDVTVARLGDDYYIAFTPGTTIQTLRSKDLVNWEVVGRHELGKDIGDVWAPDLVAFDGQLHLYMPVRAPATPENPDPSFTTLVISTSDPAEGWSDPIDLETWGIDPGVLITPEGKKFLYVEKGTVVPLSDDGMRTVGEQKKVYDGWGYPESWIVQCPCLEAPKFVYKDGYYFFQNAQGGTAGPSTAHMGIVARSRDPMGPWENSPYNPLMRTWSSDEPWWQQGHGDIIQGPAGDWWMLYTAKRAGYIEMGKHTLLVPIGWTDDGWPVIKDGAPPESVFRKPAGGENVGHGLPLSDDFTSLKLGLQWRTNKADTGFYRTGSGELIMRSSGHDPISGTRLIQSATNISYEVSVEIECPDGAVGGLVVLSDPFDGIGTDGSKAFFTNGPEWRLRGTDKPLENKGTVFLKIRNLRKDLDFLYSHDGVTWKSWGKGIREADSYRGVALYAAGEGEVIFRNYRYVGLE